MDKPAPAPPFPLPPHFRRNFWLGVINGLLFNMSASFISLSLVVPGLISALGGNNALVGTMSAMDQGGWLLPQLWVGAQVQHRPRKLPVYRTSAILRGGLFVGMVALVALAGHLPHRTALAGLLVLYGLYALAAGWAAVPFQEVVAKTIPPDRRGRYFGLRLLGGGLGTILLASPVVRVMLDDAAPWPFPQNYALLFGLACASAIAGLACFSMVREPPSADTPPAGALRDQLRLLPTLWHGRPHLTRFILYRVLSRLGAIATPFYILYARLDLGISEAMSGDYMAIIGAGLLLSNLLWARFSDRRGNRLLLRLGAILGSAAPLVALGLPALGLRGQLNAYAFAAVFVLAGLGDACMGIGVSSYMLELLPERDRPAGLGLINTIAGVASMLTIAGGTLADLLGYPALFLLAAALSVGSVAVSWFLAEPRRESPGPEGKEP